MSKAVRTRKFVLVSLEDVDDPKHMQRKIRRYLNGNKLEYIFSSDAEEMKEYLDKIHVTRLSEIANSSPDEDAPICVFQKKPIVNVSSNQEILEKWARETFAADSSELKLLFGTPADKDEEGEEEESNGANSPRDIDDETEQEMLEKEVPKIFSVHSLDSEPGDNRKDDNQDVTQKCLLCNVDVDVGKTRNTKIKRQAQHVVDKHPKDIFFNLRISQRYKCLRCHRIVPVWKSPCEHITDYHLKDEEANEFTDLWSKEQLNEFNKTMEDCFGRQLPVPRSRRHRNGLSWFLSEKPYSIQQGDEVVKIENLSEKLHREHEVGQRNKVDSEVQRRPMESEEAVKNDVSYINHDHDYEDEDDDDYWSYRRRRYYDEDDDEDDQFYVH